VVAGEWYGPQEHKRQNDGEHANNPFDQLARWLPNAQAAAIGIELSAIIPRINVLAA